MKKTGTNSRSRPQILLAAVGGLMLTIGSAQAALIAPGGIQSSPSAASDAGLTLVAKETIPVVGIDAQSQERFTATIVSSVLLEASGTYDFEYQVTNTTPSPLVDSLDQIAVTGFAHYTTDVNYVPATGTVNYTTASRSAATPPPVAGLTLTFNYPQPNVIGPGDTTDTIFVKTNATSYDNNGTTSVIDGATAVASTYQPSVPEPISLCGVACGALGLLLRRPSRPSIKL